MDINLLFSISDVDAKLDYIFQSVDEQNFNNDFHSTENDIQFFINYTGDQLTLYEYVGLLTITFPWKKELNKRPFLYEKLKRLTNDERIYYGLE